jgi:ADP-ribosyl-[dinitrogen reductase] hydrolase
MNVPYLERFTGCLFGLAAGDALGTAVEFQSPGSFPPVRDMRGGGPFQLQPGQWTDDTSMALCLAESLVECHGFDPADQMLRYLRWWRRGHLSSTGRCFDIGSTVRAALESFERTAQPFSGPTGARTAGNGSLMRLAPVPLYFASEPREAIERAGESSRTTHGAPAAVDACRYFAGLLLGALREEPKERILEELFCPIPGHWKQNRLDSAVEAVAAGSFKRKEPPALRGTGYVVDCLESALWAFHRAGSFEEGCLLAVNLGDDADTTGAVYGQLAGAYYGLQAIPAGWREKIALGPVIATLAERLFRHT